MKRIYIWQDDEWPRFRWDSRRLLKPLGEVRQLQGRVAGMMDVLGFDVRGNLGVSVLTDDIMSSSAIEGVTLNADSVRSSVARRLGVEADGVIACDHYVEGLVDIVMDAVGNASAPLTEERLFGWHSALFPTGRSGMVRITVGGWRIGDEPMQVVLGAFGHEKVHYEAPASSDVPCEMARFLKWASSTDTDPLVCAAVAHLWFVTVHPFDDGNGRISRTVADMFLSRADVGGGRFYSMSAEILRRKKSYYEILERTQKGSLDITEWILWFLDCLCISLGRSIEAVETVCRKGRWWERFRDVEVNERQRKVINRLWDGFEGKLTTSKWAKICHCSQDTAGRDIRDLISKGMLLDSGERGRSTNYLLAE